MEFFLQILQIIISVTLKAIDHHAKNSNNISVIGALWETLSINSPRLLLEVERIIGSGFYRYTLHT
jgi:hypothetical protein